MVWRARKPLPWALRSSAALALGLAMPRAPATCSFEVTVTSVSLSPFVPRRGLSNTNQRLSPLPLNRPRTWSPVPASLTFSLAYGLCLHFSSGLMGDTCASVLFALVPCFPGGVALKFVAWYSTPPCAASRPFNASQHSLSPSLSLSLPLSPSFLYLTCTRAVWEAASAAQQCLFAGAAPDGSRPGQAADDPRPPALSGCRASPDT